MNNIACLFLETHLHTPEALEQFPKWGTLRKRICRIRCGATSASPIKRLNAVKNNCHGVAKKVSKLSKMNKMSSVAKLTEAIELFVQLRDEFNSLLDNHAASFIHLDNVEQSASCIQDECSSTEAVLTL